MAVQFVGNMQRRPSVLSSLKKDVVAAGNTYTDALKSAAVLKSQLAETQLAQKKVDMKHADTLLDELGLKRADWSDQEWKNYLSSDSGKTALKTVKSVYPERVMDGDIITTQPKDVYKKALDKLILGVKTKLTNGVELTTGEQNLLKMEGLKDEYAEAIDLVRSEYGYLMSGTPEEQKQAATLIENTVKFLRDKRGGIKGRPELLPSGGEGASAEDWLSDRGF